MLGFKWQQSSFAYNIIFAGHIDFCIGLKKMLILYEPNKIK